MAITSIDKLLIYRRTDDTDLIPLDSPTTLLGANSTSNAAVSFGFSFEFDGAVRTGGQVFAYGYLRLAGTLNSSTNSNLFAASTNELIAPLYDFWETADTVGYIKSETQGVAPFRRCVIEWYVNLRQGQTGSVYDRMKFQCVLYETWNRIEFRYGAVETAGSPSRTLYSASIGIKGPTNVVATNFRDCWVENKTLGGSNTTSTQTIAYPGTWPAWALVIEPVYPMVGRYLPIGFEDLAGLVRADSEPFRKLCNNNNWLWCKHAPPLINVCPYTTEGTAHTFVFPVIPSAEAKQYTVRIGVWSTAGGTVVISIGGDNAANPQPGTDAHWTTLTGGSASPTAGAGALTWLTPMTVTIPDDASYLRFKFTNSGGSSYQVHSILVAPVEQTDVDYTTPLTSSGWIAASIGQIAQQGAAIHPELINRLFRNVARVLADRRQCLWSFAQSSVSTRISHTGDGTAVQYAYGPASIRGQAGATVTVRLFAKEGVDSAKVRVGEIGGSSVVFTVTGGGSYLAYQATLRLVSDEPVIYMHATSKSDLVLLTCLVEWQPGD